MSQEAITLPNPGASLESIQFHYDVSNEFYKLFLDESLTYSCALWKEDESFEEAQQNKLEHHILQSKANKAKRVLDVGCGWGSTLKKLKQDYQVPELVGLTLSQEQADHVNQLQLDNTTIRVESWTDHVPDAPYDAIISIGAFEHFAKLGMSEEDRIAGYRAFFKKCHEWLSPSGHVSLQTIACGNMLREDFSNFFATEIFPESDLPKLAEIAAASDLLFEAVNMRNDRMMYGKTSREWLRRLKNNREKAVELVGEEVVKRYEKYFHLLIVGFESYESMTLYRITFRKINKPRALK
jgi:cyclopropane-fatty-acyl-phospholipid synthase